MKKILAYINNNRMFVIMLSVIIAITLGLGYYYVTNIRETKPIEKPDDPITDESTETSISSFQGVYDTKTKQIRLTWSIKNGDQKVSSIKLYHNDSILADVSTLNSYVLNQTVYQFPGGNNSFIIKVFLEDEAVLEKTTNVNIEYFSTIECKTEPSDIGVLVKLTYQYNSSAKIGVPRIVANSLPYQYDFIYKETTKEDLDNGFIKETTIFEIDTRQATTEEKVTVRWIFDTIGMSYDFPITLSIKK